MATINLPRICNEIGIFRFCKDLKEQNGVEEVTLDFSRMARVEPFAMIYIAKFIRDFHRANSKTKIICIGHRRKEYAANMGFFKSFGLKHGKSPSSSIGSQGNFLPFTILDMQKIKEEAKQEYTVGQEIIEKHSLNLAEILTQQKGTDLVKTLNYSIREIIRNVYEHSQSNTMLCCAQHWPTYHKVEIVIADNGIGLKKSLEANPHIKSRNDSEAIQQALMPAISSKNYEGIKIDTNNPWHNSGYGLYMSSRICRLGGSFLVCSGSHGIKLTEEKKEYIDLGHQCTGTVIRMMLDTRKLTELNTMLDQFRKEGYEIAKGLKGVGTYSASAASKMLSTDFNNIEKN